MREIPLLDVEDPTSTSLSMFTLFLRDGTVEEIVAPSHTKALERAKSPFTKIDLILDGIKQDGIHIFSENNNCWIRL